MARHSQQAHRRRRTSSYSAGNGGCVEVAHSSRIQIRDSKQPHSPELGFTPHAWCNLLVTINHST